MALNAASSVLRYITAGQCVNFRIVFTQVCHRRSPSLICVAQPRRISAVSIAERIANECCERLGQSLILFSVVQPRRISAVSIAERVANERCERLGQSIGYSVRFETALPRPFGSILYCTVGQ